MKRKSTLESAIMMLLLFAAFLGSGAARSTDVDIVPEFYFTAMTNYYDSANRSTWYDTYAATGEINWYPQLKPYYGGLFVDFRDSSSDRLNDNLNVGGYFRYNFSRWDSTTWLFVNRSPDSDQEWVYATRLRYRVVDGHKVGVEALAPVERADKPKLMLGYYGQVSSALSLNVLAGTVVDAGDTTVGRIELVWRIR